MSKVRFIAIYIDGELTVHAPGAGGADTLCGTDMDDPAIGHKRAELPLNAKINCMECLQVYRAAHHLSPASFTDHIWYCG